MPAAGNGQKRIVAITSCPTGIAHTFMAAEGLRKAAESMGHWIKVETQGSVGAKNVLTDEDVAAADAVIIAADTKVDLSRFVGKPLYETGTKEALKHGEDVVTAALSDLRPSSIGAGTGAGDGGGTAAGGAGGGGTRWYMVIYQHLMTGISHMLPLIVAGGLLIAISFAFDIHSNDPANADDVRRAACSRSARAAFSLFLPVLAGYISYSIADRPGLAPGLVGGLPRGTGQHGLPGRDPGRLPGRLRDALPGDAHQPAAGARRPQTGPDPAAALDDHRRLGDVLRDRGADLVAAGPADERPREHAGHQPRPARAVLGAMMAFDMGGPLNKVAYAFSVGLIASGVREPMAAVMAAGMTPPLALVAGDDPVPATAGCPRSARPGKAAAVLGLCFITEGAIPFAARNPARIIPALMVGSATAGALSMAFNAASIVPHGGIIDLFVPGAITNPGGWAIALAGRHAGVHGGAVRDHALVRAREGGARGEGGGGRRRAGLSRRPARRRRAAACAAAHRPRAHHAGGDGRARGSWRPLAACGGWAPVG